MKKKIVTLCLAAALAVTAIGGTLAYFTDYTDVTKNTFTVGNVDITLDEAVVDDYGVKDGDNRTAEGVGENYKLIPGHTYVKDPTVTVKKGSEVSYVRMFVTFNKADKVNSILGPNFLPQNFVAGWDNSVWLTTNEVVEKDNTLTYEFRYYTTVDARETEQKLDALFDTFTLPSTLTNNQVKELDGLNIDVKAEAIQADTFTSAEAAWAAFTTGTQQK